MARVKTLIGSHEREGRECVEQHLQELRVKREELEKLKSENSQFIQDNNVVEIIRGKEERAEDMGTASMLCGSELPIPNIEGLRGAFILGNSCVGGYVG